MDPLTYLTTPAAGLGQYGWPFFIAQIVLAVAGLYVAFLRGDAHPVRGQALRSLGYALLLLGGLGTLFGVFRLAAIEPLTAHGWFYLVAALEVGLAAYALYFARAVYPARRAEYERANRSSGSQRAGRPQPALQPNGNGRAASSFEEPRPAASGRRDSRRDRKRRNR